MSTCKFSALAHNKKELTQIANKPTRRQPHCPSDTIANKWIHMHICWAQHTFIVYVKQRIATWQTKERLCTIYPHSRDQALSYRAGPATNEAIDRFRYSIENTVRRGRDDPMDIMECGRRHGWPWKIDGLWSMPRLKFVHAEQLVCSEYSIFILLCFRPPVFFSHGLHPICLYFLNIFVQFANNKMYTKVMCIVYCMMHNDYAMRYEVPV